MVQLDPAGPPRGGCAEHPHPREEAGEGGAEEGAAEPATVEDN